MKNDDRSTSGLLIDSIQTRSMQEARSNNRNAFALLKSIDGTPSLVKIFDLPNDKQVRLLQLMGKIIVHSLINFEFKKLTAAGTCNSRRFDGCCQKANIGRCFQMQSSQSSRCSHCDSTNGPRRTVSGMH